MRERAGSRGERPRSSRRLERETAAIDAHVVSSLRRRRTSVTDARPPLERHRLVHPDGRQFHVYGRLDGTLEGQPIGPRSNGPCSDGSIVSPVAGSSCRRHATRGLVARSPSCRGRSTSHCSTTGFHRSHRRHRRRRWAHNRLDGTMPGTRAARLAAVDVAPRRCPRRTPSAKSWTPDRRQPLVTRRRRRRGRPGAGGDLSSAASPLRSMSLRAPVRHPPSVAWPRRECPSWRPSSHSSRWPETSI